MLQILYVCGQIANVVLVMDVPSDQSTLELFELGSIYFFIGTMSDLMIYEILFSPSIAYPVFVYAPGNLFTIIVGTIVSS